LAPHSDLRFEVGQIPTLARSRWICDGRPLAVKAEIMLPIVVRDWTLNPYVKGRSRMQQLPIAAYLALKTLSARESHDKPKAILGSNALTYRSTICCLPEP
jgi:hypothetical protein